MKKFYKENRIFVILMGIALVCIAIIIAMMAGYVVRSSKGDKYGNRLDGISDVEIKSEDVTKMEESILEKPKVQDVTINIHGKIINFNIDFENDATLEEVKNVSIGCMELFEENYLNFYALQFLITKSSLEESSSNFPIIGYRNAGAATITWSHNAKN
ncbi:MAG: hypothetical protein HFG33_01370 [Bacilli bacterium]|nr:hypothetical protein [Bacilli bacterium]